MFATRLRELRKAKGLSQPEFAQAFHIASGTISMWETGKRQPDYETLTRLASFFDVSTDYLLGNEEKNSSGLPELKGVYLNFARRAQDSGLDPSDIELILETAEKLRKKKPES